MKYYTFKERNKKEMDEFIDQYVFFAFSNEQFEKGLEKLNQRHPDLNITMDNYQDKLYSWIGGGFVMKGVKKLEKQMWRRMHKHERKFLSKFKNLVNALEYEMGNHECSYTGEYTNCLPPLGFSYQDLKKNKRLRKAFIIARNNQYEWYKKHGW